MKFSLFHPGCLLILLVIIFSCATPGVLEATTEVIVEDGKILPDPGEVRMIDGSKFRKIVQNVYGGEPFVSWVGSYSFAVECNTCTGVVTCYEKEKHYECQQSDYVSCTLLACGNTNPIQIIPKEGVD